MGDARESLAALRADGLDGAYDFAFIDADKSGYDIYYEHCLALVRAGGLILLDNTFYMGRIAEPDRWQESGAVVDALNKKIKGDERVSMVMLPIGDGLTICRGEAGVASPLRPWGRRGTGRGGGLGPLCLRCGLFYGARREVGDGRKG